MELRKLAWDRYHARALWSTPPHATYGTMRAVAGALRDHGDLEAAYLAAAIDREIGRRTVQCRLTSSRRGSLPQSTPTGTPGGRSPTEARCSSTDFGRAWIRTFFSVGELDDLVKRDTASLEAAGYTVRPGRSFDGFRECQVMKPLIGTTTLHWTHGLVSEFCAPVPDPLFGWRLHFADLAANKALAAGSRMRKRDLVDLWMLDRHVIPLWRMACAVPGNDTDFSPYSVVEEISRNWHFAKGRDDDRVDVTIDISLDQMGPGLRNSLHEARLMLREIDPAHYGRLQVDEGGEPLTGRDLEKGGRWTAPRRGGALPAFEGLDSEMVAGLITEFGPGGSRHTGAKMEGEGGTAGNFRNPFTVPDSPQAAFAPGRPETVKGVDGPAPTLAGRCRHVRRHRCLSGKQARQGHVPTAVPAVFLCRSNMPSRISLHNCGGVRIGPTQPLTMSFTACFRPSISRS